MEYNTVMLLSICTDIKSLLCNSTTVFKKGLFFRKHSFSNEKKIILQLFIDISEQITCDIKLKLWQTISKLASTLKPNEIILQLSHVKKLTIGSYVFDVHVGGD